MSANNLYFPNLKLGTKFKPGTFTVVNDPKSGQPLKMDVATFFELAYQEGYINGSLPEDLTGSAYHKVYVKSDESGLEFKGNPGDYTPVTEDELDDLFVELIKATDGEITANAMISASGLVLQVIRNTDIGTPPDTAKLIYYDIDGEALGTIQLQDIGGSSNIATNDLVFTGNSTTDFLGYKATFDNAKVKIIAETNDNTDKVFEITSADGSSPIFDVRGLGTIYVNQGASANKYIYFYNTEVFTIGNNYAGAILDMTSSSSVFSTGPIYRGGDSAGVMGEFKFQRGQGVKLLALESGKHLYSTIRSAEPTAFANDEVSFYYDNGTNDLKIKFKKADGTEIIKTVS